MSEDPAMGTPTPTKRAATFQAGVREWMSQCFRPEISEDRLERGDRLLEEVLELLQSGGYPRERIAALGSYVYGRPIGEPSQEVGGVKVTLAAYCNTFGLDSDAAGEIELARIMQPEMMAKIRAKQAAKPTGSALPIATTIDEYNAAYDTANDALGGAFKAGFREGWLLARDPDWEDRETAEKEYPHVVDMAPAECWEAYQEEYFAMLPIAALPHNLDEGGNG